MTKKRTIAEEKDALEVEGTPVERTDLENIEAEMREISPKLAGLKKDAPAKYREVYKRYMWLIGERDRLTR